MFFSNHPLLAGAMLAWAGIVIGWILQETASYLTTRRERRKAIALALADLWEIHYLLMGLNLMFDQLESHHEIPPQAKAQLWVAIEQFMLPDSVELHKRYGQSVTTLASLDPVLGFRLRSKDIVRRLFTFLNSVAAQNAETASLWIRVQKPLIGEADKALREAILELAQKYGRKTNRQVRERLNRAHDIPIGFEEWMATIVAQAKSAESPPRPPGSP
jgi:hypothetical protein